MTRHIGQFIDNHIGAHVLTDQSLKGDIFGSILRIRVKIDIIKPLRRSLLLSFQGTEVGIDLSYEKLPITCFICGIIGHIEEQCLQFKGKNEDDLSKPYGRWFQNDVLSDNYWWPQAPLHVVNGESMNRVVVVDQRELDETPVVAVEGLSNSEIIGVETYDTIINWDINIPDLNVEVDLEETREDAMAIMSTQQIPLAWERVGLTLFRIDLNAPPVVHGETSQG
ncbi:hypothetical protein FF1_022633 [Malus domestica]